MELCFEVESISKMMTTLSHLKGMTPHYLGMSLMSPDKKKKIYSFLICFSRRACMPKYFETPTASHWSMVWESKETRSLE